MRSLKVSWLPVLMVLAFIVAACAPAAAPTAVPTTGATSQAAKPTSPPASTPQATAGAATTPVGQAKPPIKIGLLQPLTGVNANIGKDNQDGFDLYMSKIGGTVAGRKIQEVVEDTQGDPNVALTKIRKLVEQDQVNLVAGIALTSECYAVDPYVKQNQVLTMITTDCGAEGLTKDPNMRSPYLWRTTQTSGIFGYAASDWMLKNNYKKAVVIVDDYAGGYEVEDGFAHAFIDGGGTIVQEMYPALGTTDFGPFLAKIDPNSDVVVSFLIGTDGLHFGQQYSQYGWKGKLPLIDLSAVITSGPNMEQLKDAGVGIISSFQYAMDTNTPENKDFLAAWNAKYPGRLVSTDAAQGYAGAQIIAAAIQAANGNVENKDQFVTALKNLSLTTNKGPFKFDSYQNVVQNVYVYRIDKSGNQYVDKTLETVPNVGQFWTWPPDQQIKYPYGKLKGKYANINKAQLDALLAPYFK